MCSRIKSSFHGKICEIPGIAVDNFEGENLKSRAFFLSHCHSDHTRGLFSRELLTTIKSNNITIYMSNLSAAIVADDCRNDPALMSNIVSLESGTKHLTLPELFGYNEMSIRVTLIDAGHCLGSVMFLFQTSDQTVLYTGDFNVSSNDICQYVSFHDEKKEPIKIHTMYLDTTFINFKYEYFPKRSKVIESLIIIIKDWLNADSKNKVALSVSAKYGYEYVFNEIYKRLGLKVYVNEERWEFYSAHSNLCLGVTNREMDTRIHICRNTYMSNQHKWCCITEIDGFKFLFIRFSAMSWNDYEFEASGIREAPNDRIDVCFATHCSSIQIKNFVNYFCPNKVVGFPNPYTEKLSSLTNISHDNNKITPKKRRIESPKNKSISQTDRKVDKKILKQIFEI